MYKLYVCLIVFCLHVINLRAQAPGSYDKEKQPHYVLSVVDSLRSTYLGETRQVNVYLPEGYDAASGEKYPVIYIIDGGVQEDFVHITGLVQFNTQPWIARFPRSIVVGIENTSRQRDCTFPVADLRFLDRIGFKKEQVPVYGGSGNYIAFIEKELQPFIEQKYHAGKDRTLIGESLSGLLATEILLKHRYLFNTYIIVSPSLWWDAESLLAAAPRLLQGHNDGLKVYVGACAKEESKIMYDDAAQLAAVLQRGGIKTYFDYLPDEVHATVLHQAVYRAFRLLYPLH
jgi:predicted alpha/beta superfamily hydrolase